MAYSEEERRLVETHIDLADSMARRVLARMPPSIDRDEVQQVARCGLLSALKTYDPERGIKFCTYAAFRIRGDILDWFRGQDHLTRVVRRKRRAQQALEAEARQKGVCLADEALCNAPELHSLNQAIGTRDDFAPRSTWVEPTEAQRLEREAHWKELTLGLGQHEATLLYLYFHRNLTMRKLGEVFGLSESRVSQQMTEILATLRTRLYPQYQATLARGEREAG